jgi:arylsulfatase A-like enzyme
VLADAEAWLAARDPGKPFFLFIHVYDVHSRFEMRPYDAPEPFKYAFVRDYRGDLEPWEDQPVAGSAFLLAVHEGRIRISDEDLRYLKGSYDEGIAYTDDRVGRFLESLGDLENTYVAVTADHGEELRDHGGMLHCSWYDEVVRVPLFIVPPPSERERFHAPRRIADQVRLIDLRPTLLALAGLAPAGACQGKDLLPWLEEPSAKCPAGPAVLQRSRSLRFRGYKILQEEEGPLLFDLNADPKELRDVTRREELLPVLTKMSDFLLNRQKEDAAIRTVHLEAGGRRTPDQDPGAAERLRALGYTH